MNEAARDWQLWRSFLAVSKGGSLSEAARALQLTQPTVGRHIDALEQALGATLFTRSRGGLKPTHLGLSLLTHAEAMAQAVENLLRSASGEQQAAQGVVRITASSFVGTFVLPPILAAFRESQPEIVIELALSNRNENLLAREADIAVRMMRPAQAAIVARHVGRVRIGLFAASSYVERHGAPASAQQLFDHPFIGIDRDEDLLQGLELAGRRVTRESFAFRCDSDAAQFMALKAGFGIGACQLGHAAAHKDLVRVIPAIEFGYEVWVAMHEDLRTTRRVRLVFDHLAHSLSEYARLRP